MRQRARDCQAPPLQLRPPFTRTEDSKFSSVELFLSIVSLISTHE
jgi:hypothetical protein